jgi:pimeloyl-ACP methyl ester carboxylesterase
MIREEFVETASGRLRFLEAGSGWPVVLIHAFPLSADMWRPQLEDVPNGWRFIAPDVRGLGPEPRPPATTMNELADDVVAVLNHVRQDRAIIGGLSMGGYVTLAAFQRAPERFSGMILANTRATADTEDGKRGRDAMIELVGREGPGAVATQMMPKLLGDTSKRERPQLEAHVRGLIERNRAEGIAGAIRAMKDRADTSGLLPRVSLPTLVIAGVEDTLIPVAESEAMAGQLPRAQFVRLQKAGHLSSVESPKDFSEALHNWLHAIL